MENQYRVIRFELFESGKYRPMFSRPYQFESNQQHVNRIVEETQRGTDINPIRIAGLVSDMVKPTSFAGNQLTIANGWDETRILFVLEIETYVMAFNTVRTTVLTGYADKGDKSYSGYIDPNIALYVNSVANFHNIQEPTPHGLITRKVLIDNSQFMAINLTRNFSQGYNPAQNMMQPGGFGDFGGGLNTGFGGGAPSAYSPHGNQVQMMRPEVIVAAMGAYELHNVTSSVFDTRSHLSRGKTYKSRRINNTSPHYISSMLTSIRSQQDMQRFEAHPDSNFDVYNRAAASVAEESSWDDPVIALLLHRTSIESTGYVTLRELGSIFQDLNEPGKIDFHVGTNYSAFNPNQMNVDYQGAEDWDRNSFEVQVATQLITAIPAIMTECLISRVSFFISNDVQANMGMGLVAGEPLVTVTDANMIIDGIDSLEFTRTFIMRIKTELMAAITRMNNLLVTASGTIELAKDVNITVSVNGGYPTPFVAPTFCDTVYSPMLTNNANIVDSMISSVKHLSDELT